MILGLDIGGANTKAASADGKHAKSVYLPLWKNSPLEKVLKRINAEQKPEAVAVVITGELADCFSSKIEGLERIMTASCRAFSCPVYFWGHDGFARNDIINPTSMTSIVDMINTTDILHIAAANWSASAALLAREIGDCLFVDMGSTTTDLIAIKSRPLAAKTDFLRLSSGELVYMGQKWDNMSGSEQLKVATAIVRKLNPNCGFVLMDKLEQMDQDTLNEFGKWLEQEQLQVIATRVSSGKECSVIIEDGYVKEYNGLSDEGAKTWKKGEF